MITLTSDFGLHDSYVAQMKGVILGINANATLIDVTHDIEKFNIRTGAFMLASSVPYFPKGTTHMAVVDPGVGTSRRAIIIHTNSAFFVGPDNGVLMLAANNQGILHVYEVSNPNLMLPQISNTFHGRDIFAPAAAYLDSGTQPKEFGSEVTDPVLPNFSAIKEINGSLYGEVLYIDSFGNVVSNVKEKNLRAARRINVNLRNASLDMRLCKTYGEVSKGEPALLVGSHGFIELALNQDNAAEKFGVKVGDKIVFNAS